MAEAMVIKGLTVVLAKSSKEHSGVWHLYLKKVDWKKEEPKELKPPERTVFVGNTPPWASEKDFEAAFSCCGKVERVILQHAPSRGKEEKNPETPPWSKGNHRVGYIVYENKAAADKALQLPYSVPVILKSKESSSESSLERYKKAYLSQASLDIGEMKKQLTARIAKYDREQQEKEEKAREREPDVDGWITVTRSGKNKGAPRTEEEQTRVKLKESRKTKRKELVNFYAFQRREEKKQRIEELREQFQKDKSAIEKMKKERKFRPF